MATKARIQNGVVAEVLTATPFPPFHPDLVWVTCSGTVKEGWVYDGSAFAAPPPPPTPSLDDIKREFLSAVQSHIDAVAQSRGYDSGVSLATYATDTHPPFAAEAAVFIPWRSSVWLYCYQEFEKVVADTRSVTTPDAFIAELPVIAWP